MKATARSIVDKPRLDPPFDGRRPGAGMERRGELAAVEHRISGLNAIIWMGRAPPSSASVISRRAGLLAAPNYGRHGPCFAGSDLLHAASRFRPVSFVTCGRGGIGRRAALRSLWGNPWKFESSRPHQSDLPAIDLIACLTPYGRRRGRVHSSLACNGNARPIRTLSSSGSVCRVPTGVISMSINNAPTAVGKQSAKGLKRAAAPTNARQRRKWARTC